MNKRIFVFAILLVVSFLNIAFAVAPVKSLDEYREEDSKRTYLFTVNNQQFGILESIYEGESEFDGIEAFKFEEKLSFDYTALGNPMKISIVNRQYVNKYNSYVGTDLNAAIDTNFQNLYLKHVGDSIIGFFSNNDAKQNIGTMVPPDYFSIDNNMIDQLEAFLAFYGVNVGDTIIDTVFVPQITQQTVFKGVVTDYVGIRYGNLFDSAFQIDFTDPAIQKVYFTRDHKVIRVDLETQNITVILSEDPIEKYSPPEPTFGFSDFIAQLPFYAIFILIGGIFSIPFIRKQYNNPDIYIALVLGGVICSLIGATQVPLQKWFASAYLIPGLKEGGSLYYYGIFSALISGVVQEFLKIVIIITIFVVRKPELKSMTILGLFCGLGFGIYEACTITGAALQSGAMSIFSWGMFERFVAILFHATTGTLLGYGLSRGFKYVLIYWTTAVLVHSIINYMIIFLHRNVINLAMFELLVAFINIIFVLAVYLIIKRNSN
ncbi:MAG: hypothetical protein GY865_00740 [candidate division Zixibacteria bacterium]|nr:hypothetical protein [candidate division Zixibacteria bacterium]